MKISPVPLPGDVDSTSPPLREFASRVVMMTLSVCRVVTLLSEAVTITALVPRVLAELFTSTVVLATCVGETSSVF